MAAPDVEQEPFMVLEIDLRMHPIGSTPFGTRLEVPFEGTATSRLWDGERSAWGTDHITISATGTAEIDVHVVIEGGDEVFVLAATEYIRPLMRELRRMLKPVKRVMIAGGANIGARVALALEADHEVKVIERDLARAEHVAARLQQTLVLQGEGTDENMLARENIDEMDMFLALTNDDEDNIMAASLAKRLGCKRVLALINRRAYADMVQGGPIDIGLSPAQVSIGSLLTFCRRGDVARVHSLRRGAAEALELVAHGDRNSSKVVGRRIEELPVIKGAHIGAIVRDTGDLAVVRKEGFLIDEKRATVIIPHHDTVIEENDHVVVFCTRKRVVAQVEKLFQVGFQFL